MNANLLSLAQEALGGDFSKLAGSFLGESPAATQSAMGSLLPAVLGTVAQKGATPSGASGLLSLINGANLDVSSLGNIAGLFAGGGNGANALMKAGAASLVPALFGDKAGGLVNALSSASGIKSSSATNLLAMIVPIILTFLKKFIGDKKLDASSLSTLLAGQGPNLQSALDGRLTSALGFASPAAFLSGLGGQAADAARRAGAAVAPAPAPAPAPVAAGYPFKVYFDTGSAAIGSVSTATITAAAEAIKKDGAKVALTGYTDKTGDVAKNEELAKNRALAVRDALMAAGIAETSIEMRPPLLVEAGAGGSDQEARRVEISKL